MQVPIVHVQSKAGLVLSEIKILFRHILILAFLFFQIVETFFFQIELSFHLAWHKIKKLSNMKHLVSKLGTIFLEL